MKPRSYQATWLVIILLMVASLACNAVNQVGEARETVQAVATGVSQGRDLLATMGAIGTQVGGEGWMETAQALATQAGESGLLETAVAFATEQGPSALATAQAFATEQGPSAMATAQAYATQVAGSLGNLPPDIPILDGEKDAFVKSLELVSYITPIEYSQAVEFYKQQMPANGWVQASSGWIETAQTTILRFEKPDKLSTVTITHNPVDNTTVVLITIQTR